MNSIDQRYKVLLQKILNEGVRKQTRNGEVLSIFSHQIRHNMVEGFPLLTTKKMAWKSIVTELLWFLRGDTNIKYLVDNDCHIWDGDAYKNYLNETQHEASYTKEEFINLIKTNQDWAKVWGELGPIYGKQWRRWTYESNARCDGHTYYDEVWKQTDQIQNLISELKTNPDSRRLMVNAWNVGELDQMVLPPCHYGFQVYTRELSLKERLNIWASLRNDRGYDEATLNNPEQTHIWLDTAGLNMGPIPRRAISLMWNQRSVDTFLGLPFNLASYGLLLEIIAKEVNMVPEELIGNLGDVHLYSNHIEQAKEQITTYIIYIGEER